MKKRLLSRIARAEREHVRGGLDDARALTLLAQWLHDGFPADHDAVGGEHRLPVVRIARELLTEPAAGSLLGSGKTPADVTDQELRVAHRRLVDAVARLPDPSFLAEDDDSGDTPAPLAAEQLPESWAEFARVLDVLSESLADALRDAPPPAFLDPRFG